MERDDDAMSEDTQSPRAVSLEISNGIAWVTMSAPERANSISLLAVEQLHDALDRADAARARVIVLRSQGRFFSVGGDLAGFASADDPSAFLGRLARSFHTMVSRLMRSDAIVLASVQGAAAGAGFSLALAADIVLASSAASFTMAYTKVGLSPDGGSTAALIADLGLHRALELALLNPVLTAARAAELGLVTEVVAPDELEVRTKAMAERLRDGPFSAFATTKRLLRTAAMAAVETQMELEARGIAAASVNPEGKEGVRAFIDKRQPDFG
jgi:2-(1,2-epoxy-1,2-dihydrophenyl)acetyl-CoA isomerase